MKFHFLFLVTIVAFIQNAAAADTNGKSNEDMTRGMDEVLIDHIERIVVTMWDISHACSALCLQPLIDYTYQKLKEFSAPYYVTSSTIVNFCNIYKQSKQCVSKCSDGAMKTILNTFSPPFDTICSDRFEVVKQNIPCLRLSIPILIQQNACRDNCPIERYNTNNSFPNRLNILQALDVPTMVTNYGKVICDLPECVVNCYKEGLRVSCNHAAIDMMGEVIAQTVHSGINALEQAGFPKTKIPAACKRLAKSSAAVEGKTAFWVIGAVMLVFFRMFQ